MSTKYEPLTHLLRQRAQEGDSRVELLFGALDRLVDGLPASARGQRTWWANSSHVQAQAWRAAGWHVAAVDLPGQRAQPGLYRMTLAGAPGQQRARVYVGESSSLRRRAGNYRNPTPRQQTSTRVNELLRAHLATGGTVALAVTTSAELDLDAPPGALDLSRKAGRLLAENAALAVIHAAGQVDVENLGWATRSCVRSTVTVSPHKPNPARPGIRGGGSARPAPVKNY